MYAQKMKLQLALLEFNLGFLFSTIHGKIQTDHSQECLYQRT